MELGPGSDSTPLRVHVTEDGRVFVHAGSRFVEAPIDDLDRILERIGADGGSVLYSRDDPGEEPSDAVLALMDLVAEHGVEVHLAAEPPEEMTDSDL